VKKMWSSASVLGVGRKSKTSFTGSVYPRIIVSRDGRSRFGLDTTGVGRGTQTWRGKGDWSKRKNQRGGE